MLFRSVLPKISVLKGKTPEKAIFSLKSLKATLLTCFRRFRSVWLKSALFRVDAIFISNPKPGTRFRPQKRCFTESISLCTVCLKSALLRADAIFISNAKLVARSWPKKRYFIENISSQRENTRKSYFQSEIVKGNTFDMFPPFLHCLPQKRTFESGRYFHLKSQARDPISASKTLFYRKYQFLTTKHQKKLFSV